MLVLVVVLDLLAVKKSRAKIDDEKEKDDEEEYDDENETLNRCPHPKFRSSPPAVAGWSLKGGRSFLETRKSQTNLISAGSESMKELFHACWYYRLREYFRRLRQKRESV